MNSTQRGALIFGGIIAVLGFFACILPFVLLPAIDSAVTLPVITLPAEYYKKDWPFPWFELVNTLGGALLANIIVAAIALGVWRASKQWTQEVPGRFQGFVELIVEFWWGLTKEQAGDSPKTKNILMPLVASIFLFLLAANVGKLLPGVESVGVLHCAAYEPVTFNGLPVEQRSFLGRPYFTYRVDGALQTGTPANYDSYHQCEAMLGYQPYIEDGYLPTELDPFFDEAVTVEVEDGMTLEDVLADAESQLEEAQAAGLPASNGRDEIRRELRDHAYDAIAIDYKDPYAIYTEWRDVEFSLEEMLANNVDANGVVALEFEHDDDSHAVGEVFDYNGTTYRLPDGATMESALEGGQTVVVRPELIGAEATTRENQLYTVAPFIRGVATDLSFTIGLALMSFVFIQYFGLSTLGPDYLQKFVNLRALGNAGKNPLGVVDFIVGLFEIISELGKVISLAFRLFGAIFAGSILFVVFMFLTGTMIPVIILLLEVIVGTAQALVFAVLTLLFCAQAMISHHHDDDHEHAH